MTLHAHLQFQSRDCDGRYEHSRKAEMTAEERESTFGNLEFKERIMRDIVDITAVDGALSIEEDGLTWHENTEEGYRMAQARWCGEEPEGRNC